MDSLTDMDNETYNYIMDKKFCEYGMSCLGREVEVQLRDRTIDTAVFYSQHPEVGDVVVADLESEDKRVLEFKHIGVMKVQDVPTRLPRLNLQTDTQLARGPRHSKKTLIRWEDFEGQVEPEDALLQAEQHAQWDQFQLNNQKFGINFDYKDEYYTTKLDLDKVGDKAKQRAEQLDQELHQEPQEDNRHILEDRGLLNYQHDDEELIYSAVVGSGAYQSTAINQSVHPPKNDLKKATKKSLRLANNNFVPEKQVQPNYPLDKQMHSNYPPDKQIQPQFGGLGFQSALTKPPHQYPMAQQPAVFQSQPIPPKKETMKERMQKKMNKQAQSVKPPDHGDKPGMVFGGQVAPLNAMPLLRNTNRLTNSSFQTGTFDQPAPYYDNFMMHPPAQPQNQQYPYPMYHSYRPNQQ